MIFDYSYIFCINIVIIEDEDLEKLFKYKALYNIFKV